jgi:predicted nucleotidyltransferase component of viral defense system
MSEKIIAALKNKLNELAPGLANGPDVRLNAIKEELQYYVLNFIYHHPEYQKWVMYGGSALRIIHGLDRMSVDLDFEINDEVTDDLLSGLKNDLENYFVKDHGVGKDFLFFKTTEGRGLTLKFAIGKQLNLGTASDLVHVKIDLNPSTTLKTVTERRPIAHGQFSFVILTYNMSALMASKIAAILLRPIRGVGDKTYGEKGRDIYDLLWYMGRTTIPDLDYLKAKGVQIDNLKDLLSVKLVLKMNNVSQENLKEDLTPLFDNPVQIESWLKNWRELFINYLKKYEIRTIKGLKGITINQDSSSLIYIFAFRYEAEGGWPVRIVYQLSWLRCRVEELDISADDKILGQIEYLSGIANPKQALRAKLEKYATLFSRKNTDYFKKSNHVVIGDVMETKLISTTNSGEQLRLTKEALLSCGLEDLLK